MRSVVTLSAVKFSKTKLPVSAIFSRFDDSSSPGEARDVIETVAGEIV
jgi:hypothetical protein